MSLSNYYNEIMNNNEDAELEKIAEAMADEQIEAEIAEGLIEEDSSEIEKLAEDYITAGRFMAIGYMDEMEKLASFGDLGAGKVRKMYSNVKNYFNPKAIFEKDLTNANTSAFRSKEAGGKKLGASIEARIKNLDKKMSPAQKKIEIAKIVKEEKGKLGKYKKEVSVADHQLIAHRALSKGMKRAAIASGAAGGTVGLGLGFGGGRLSKKDND